MNCLQMFEEWYDSHFNDTQGEDSPYSYDDVKIAFITGWHKNCKNKKKKDIQEGERMKEIIINFLTEKGAKAYALVTEEGDKQSWKNKKISKAVAEDQVISENPLVVRIKVKIGWLAVKCDLESQTVNALKKFGAERGKDFTMEVN